MPEAGGVVPRTYRQLCAGDRAVMSSDVADQALQHHDGRSLAAATPPAVRARDGEVPCLLLPHNERSSQRHEIE